MRFFSLLLLLFSFLPSCASIVSDSSYPVTFSSNPTGALLIIRDRSGREIFRGKAPTTIDLDAGWGYFSSAKYLVEASLPGYEKASTSLGANFDGWYIGNILFGGFLGFFVIDPATGAMWKLKKHCMIQLSETPKNL